MHGLRTILAAGPTTIPGAGHTVRFKRNDESIGMGAWVFASLALILGLGALVVAGQALTRSDDAKQIAAAAQGTPVALKEFAIDPSTIAVDSGGSLSVKNTGTV